MNGPVLVTGALGNVGRAVVTAMVDRGLPVRAADLDVEAVRAAFDGVEAVTLDFLDPATFGPALDGVDGMFLVRPPAIAQVGSTLNALIDAAAQRGVRHIVFSSVAGAERNRIVPHHRVETHLRTAGVPWTILRPGFFAQNLAGPYRADIRDDDRIFLPAGDARIAWLDVRDLGEVAAMVFAEHEEHRFEGYHLTGPEAVTLHQVAAVLSKALDRPIRYEPTSVLGYVRHLQAGGMALPQVLVQTILHVGLRRGDAAEVDPTLARMLDHPPRTIAEYVHDHAELWQPTDGDRHTPVVEGSDPPAVLRSVMNPLMRTVLTSRFGDRLGDRLVLLEFLGRRSGTRYEVPVGVHEVDGHTTVVTKGGWRVNFRGGRRANLYRNGRWHEVDGVLIDDVDTVAATYRTLLERAGTGRGAQQLGLRVNVDRLPTHDEVVEAVHAEGLSLVRLTPAGQDADTAVGSDAVAGLDAAAGSDGSTAPIVTPDTAD